MDKNAIKKFAVWARVQLIERVSQKAVQYGIEEDKMVDGSATIIGETPLSDKEIKQRKALIARIKEKTYKQVMEEVAYTWFNRFIALRFMEVNNYLPSHVRVFTNENDDFDPQILTEAINLDLEGLDMEKVFALKEAEATEELYRYLLITQCNALNKILPKMFQKIADYTELLLPDNLLRKADKDSGVKGSVLYQMVTDIPQEDWLDAVQIIGWLYQYYNAEKKDEVFAALKKNVKITKENIPAATQLFTPDWIVRYMVENSLGRIFIDKKKSEGIFDDGRGTDEMTWEKIENKRISNEKSIADQMGWKYYLPEAEQTQEVRKQLDQIQDEYKQLEITDIKVIDPCCGSGHILGYLFDVLVQMYENYGYTIREAVENIITKNLYGLDIDDRAAQLAYFAVMMKARQYDRRFFSHPIQPKVYPIQESNSVNRKPLNLFGVDLNQLEKTEAVLQTEGLLDALTDAKEYGSILQIENYNWPLLRKYAAQTGEEEQTTFDSMELEKTAEQLHDLIEIGEALAQKYDVVVTNPPYMSNKGMIEKLSAYIHKYYKSAKVDMYAVFMLVCRKMVKRIGYNAMITQHSWMFLSSQKELRLGVYKARLINMVHLGSRAFDDIGGEVVQTASFVVSPIRIDRYLSNFIRLVSISGQEEKRQGFFNQQNKYIASIKSIEEIPDAPLAYWLSDKAVAVLKNNSLFENIAKTRAGMITGNNEMFVRLWFEISYTKSKYDCHSREDAIHSGCKWFPYSKGGEFRKWYGNNDYVVNWENDGFMVRNYKDEKGNIPAHAFNLEYIFKNNVCWNSLSSNRFSARYTEYGYLYDAGGSFASLSNDKSKQYLGFLNSCVAFYYLSALNPTMNFQKGNVGNLPIIQVRTDSANKISKIVADCLILSQDDWDSFETSWDFKKHPLISVIAKNPLLFEDIRNINLAECYQCWKIDCNERFAHLKANEEELNRIFIEIYGLKDELTPEVDDKDVTVHRIFDTKEDVPESMKGSNYVRTKRDEIVSLISYAVGCMFGRYSLYNEGLLYAGGPGGDFGSLVEKIQDFLKVQGKSIFPENEFYPDADNIIPICDDEYFTDDIVARFVRFVEVVYGKDTLDENLAFIADALGGKGQPKEVIRNYFLNEFYTDHYNTYHKRPIYWLFDSGKKNGFKALIYMHRYQPDTIARIRTDYVHEQQARYHTAIADLEQRIASATTSERVKLNKLLKKLTEQDAELRVYEEKIHHLADQMIPIDLDDGVKVNYAKFQDVLAKIK